MSLDRLIYLGVTLKPTLPPKKLMSYVDQGDLLFSIISKGLDGAAINLNTPLPQLQQLYEKGEKRGPGTHEEFKTLLCSRITTQVSLAYDTESISFTEKLTLDHALGDYFYKSNDKDLIGAKEISLADEDYEQFVLPKWDSGFTPIDYVSGGLYQGIVVLVAPPGTGKTSLMLSLMESIRANNLASSLWFFELEIPMQLMMYRLNPIKARTKFYEDDRIITGIKPIEEILNRLEENPDPNRIIFFDSPDVLAGGTDEGRRFELEAIFRNLIRVKEQVKCVITCSQPKQSAAAAGNIQLTSLSESWAKAQYSDLIIGVSPVPRMQDGFSLMKVQTVKNRFGPNNRKMTFGYNYEDMTWTTWSEEENDDSDW